MTALGIGGAPVAFAFPGVGVSPCGAEPDFLASNRGTVAPFLRRGTEWAGVDLERALAGETIGELSPRAFQLLTYAFSCATAAVFRDLGARPRWIAGYSSGIYAALWAAGCFSFEAGLALVAKAHELMTEAVDGRGPYAMGVVVGLPRREFDEILARLPSLRVANTNSDVSAVFGGLAAEVEAAILRADEAGASRAKLLAADAPIHHPMLREVSRAFREYLTDLRWTAPECPVLSSIDQALLTETEALKDFTAANLSTPIHWQRVIEKLILLGVAVTFECGHGVSLTQNARFIAGGPRHVNVRNWRRAVAS